MSIGAYMKTLRIDEALPAPELAKPLPRVVTKPIADKKKADKGKVFRDAVWDRDEGKSRATGNPLRRSGTVNPDELGEVDHVLNRSTNPDKIYDVGNGILLSKRENRLKKTPCPRAPEHHMFEVSGPADRGKPQTFRWRNVDGKVIKETVG